MRTFFRPISLLLALLISIPATQAESDHLSYFELPLTESDPLRVTQSNELNDYIRHLQQDDSRLRSILHPNYSSIDAFVRSTTTYRQAFQESIGYPPPGAISNAEAEFTLIGEDDIGIYFRVLIPTLPNVQTQGIYILPKVRTGPVPLILALHGGGGSPEKALFNGGGNYHDRVRGAVKRGYAVFAPQMLFPSEGLPREIRWTTDRRLRLVGTSITAVEIFKHRRSLDVLLTRSEIDPSRVGVVGLSYGGFYALMTAAFEPRIKVVVSSCYYGVQEGRYEQDELSVPSDFEFFNRFTLFHDSELAALVCPRPLLIQAGSDDRSSHREPGIPLATISAGDYDRLGLSDRFEHLIFDGGHEFHDASAWPFIQKHL